MASANDPLTEETDDQPTRRRFVWVLGALALVLTVAVAMMGRDWRTALHNGGKITTEDYVHWGLWWASALNAGLCAVLALTARWWARANSEFRIPNSGFPRRELLWLCVILVGAGTLRWSRMDLSLYNDEAHTFRRYIAGHLRGSGDGNYKWRQVKWVETFWLNQVGNNSTPCSVLGRVCYDTWKKFSHAKDGTMCETALRLPAWIAGMGSLVVLWLLLRTMGEGSACWWGVIFASLHPWHVRYSTEARGYGLMLLGVSLAFYFLWRAMEDSRWRWWLGFGAAQFLTIWAFPGAVYFFGVLNGLLILLLAWRALRCSLGWSPVMRCGVSLLLAGMVTLEIMLPTVPQLVAAMDAIPSLKGPMGLAWWQDAIGGLLFGIRWVDSDRTNPWNLSFARELGLHAWLAIPLIILCLTWTFGALLLCRRGAVSMLIATSAPIAVVVSWVLMARQGKYLHCWYVLYALPGMVCALGAALDSIHIFCRHIPFRPFLVAAFVSWSGVWLWADARYAWMSKENLKGIIPMTRGASYPTYLEQADPSLLAAIFSDADVYDPPLEVIDDEVGLDRMIAKARKMGRPLFVTYGRLGLMTQGKPILLARLQDQKEFTRVNVSFGLDEEQFTHFVVRWIETTPREYNVSKLPKH